MKKSEASSKLWYYCPKCGQKLLLHEEGAKSEKVFLKCKRCKNEIEIKLP